MGNKRSSIAGPKSGIDRSRSGRLVLTVHYAGKEWDAAIQKAMREHGFSDGDDLTVSDLPEGM
jgi:hypothetical protein